MATVKLRARYNQTPLKGIIRVSQAVGLYPTQYSLILLHDLNGTIVTKRQIFRTIEDAITHASDYGFLTQNWTIQTQSV